MIGIHTHNRKRANSSEAKELLTEEFYALMAANQFYTIERDERQVWSRPLVHGDTDLVLSQLFRYFPLGRVVEASPIDNTDLFDHMVMLLSANGDSDLDFYTFMNSYGSNKKPVISNDQGDFVSISMRGASPLLVAELRSIDMPDVAYSIGREVSQLSQVVFEIVTEEAPPMNADFTVVSQENAMAGIGFNAGNVLVTKQIRNVSAFVRSINELGIDRVHYMHEGNIPKQMDKIAKMDAGMRFVQIIPNDKNGYLIPRPRRAQRLEMGYNCAVFSLGENEQPVMSFSFDEQNVPVMKPMCAWNLGCSWSTRHSHGIDILRPKAGVAIDHQCMSIQQVSEISGASVDEIREILRLGVAGAAVKQRIRDDTIQRVCLALDTTGCMGKRAFLSVNIPEEDAIRIAEARRQIYNISESFDNLERMIETNERYTSIRQRKSA